MRYKMISAAVFFSIYMQGAVADPVDSNACSTTNSQSLIQAIGCGSIHGSARLFSYSTHNAYFARGLNQDSTTLGGYITYTTAPFYGFQAAVGVEGQTNLLAGSDSVAELAHVGALMKLTSNGARDCCRSPPVTSILTCLSSATIPMPGYYLTFIVQLT